MTMGVALARFDKVLDPMAARPFKISANTWLSTTHSICLRPGSQLESTDVRAGLCNDKHSRGRENPGTKWLDLLAQAAH